MNLLFWKRPRAGRNNPNRYPTTVPVNVTATLREAEPDCLEFDREPLQVTAATIRRALDERRDAELFAEADRRMRRPPEPTA